MTPRQGRLPMYVLVASRLRDAPDPQSRKRLGENMVAIQTRVRVSLCLDLSVSQYELEGQGSRPQFKSGPRNQVDLRATASSRSPLGFHPNARELSGK